jgi:predicted DNA binding CopG/RHH family protein
VPAGRPRVPGLQIVTIRLRGQDIKAAKRQAARVAQPYQTVIRAWVAEKAAGL